ncbi:MAG: BON domain-containing protein [Pyrinomonadaceae bacterium]|jgi:type IV secretory pathway VirB10-like protein|nr:BON domain-containing protein [Pyrinomonadaceae bacterium]
MDRNEETVQKRVVVNTPGQRSEVLTERTERVPPESGASTGTIAIIAILAITAVAVIFYIVSNRNANESANRNANLDVATQAPPQAPPTTIIQQPAPAQQAPVIIQQPAPAQQAPVIIQQPAQPSQREFTSANDDANMQDIATKRLTQELDMAGVVMTVTDARAVLTGTVNSAATKAKAEQIVKAVRGVKSVDNQIVVPGF